MADVLPWRPPAAPHGDVCACDLCHTAALRKGLAMALRANRLQTRMLATQDEIIRILEDEVRGLRGR